MSKKKWIIGAGAVVGVAVAGLWWAAPTINGPFLDFLTGKEASAVDEQTANNRLQVPEGFKVGIYADGVEKARMMRFTAVGDMIVATHRDGKIVLLHADKDGDGRADGRTLLADGLDLPSGIDLDGEYLYIAEETQVSRAPFDAATRTMGKMETIFTGMPDGGNHRTRTLGIGPDGRLYVTVGSTCNVCIETEPYRAEMIVMNPDGSEARTYATGLRNSVGFDWQPETGKLFATDNGRDLLGDNYPHCELNEVVDGGFYGWPFANNDKEIDPDMGKGHEADVARSIAPVHGFGAHRAPLGMRFLTPGREPAGYEGAALVAEHGSWNSSVLVGYKVVSLHWGPDGKITERDFMTGFEKDEDVIGRPVDVVQGPDGAIYVSDDYSGTIYRVTWGGMEAGTMDRAAADATDPLAGIDPARIEERAGLGKLLFIGNECASCHVQEAAPEGVAVKELKNLKARFDIAGLKELLANPPGPMPTYELSDAEREALAIYLLKDAG